MRSLARSSKTERSKGLDHIGGVGWLPPRVPGSTNLIPALLSCTTREESSSVGSYQPKFWRPLKLPP
jgi:hypothetical protein